MNTEELLLQIRLTHRQYHQRFGQALLNQAYEIGTTPIIMLVDSLVGSPVYDPYEAVYEHDPRVQAFIEKIREVLG